MNKGRMQEVLLLIGKLNYTWTNTESLLIYLIAFLMVTSKEAAIVVFLTLNTTRARLDLIDRLAKMRTTSPQLRTEILSITGKLRAESRLRNKYNHCIYSFDESGELESTQLMRIAEFDDDIRYGKVEEIDDDELQRISASIENISGVNKLIWLFMESRRISA